MTEDSPAAARLPSLYIPHGGGPCFFMPDPQENWAGMAAYLRGLAASLPRRPRAILIVSGHWEAPAFTFTAAEGHPGLIYDYYGFPPETYQLAWPAPGDPALAERGAALLRDAGLPAGLDAGRGFDHGVFVPMKVAFPDSDVPTVQMSLAQGLDPALHLAAGRALAPLRDEGVLVIGSGMSFHNMRGFGNPQAEAPSRAFDEWLGAAATAGAEVRADSLTRWAAAPFARLSHPREEHLLPLMVAAGASDEAGQRDYNELVLGTAISAFRFA
ncbi:dioxygenase [Altererythrobacter sp. B11]|uniref:DODA-type extradiol aromatic ring-opening family dioxygenase n=1 Tax=Altererythrobacter sp. B11 TaxID=2060312 RepID=UPI000DC6DC10|nr:class III extradiol ring-cleavage dioxygenase [Altererythrobacter sp. B11]BBC74344.1 dioxygenase [Altererythrobacter sp. B11]